MNYNLKKNKQGFTLIELMLVVIIIGVLASLSIPRFLEASKKAKYSQAHMFLKRMYVGLLDFYTEKGCYPADVYPNIKPPGLVPLYVDEWPSPTRDPLNSMYDYQEWNRGGGFSWIGVTYVGEDLLHDRATNWGSYYTTHGKPGEILSVGDDLFIVVDLKGVPCP